MTNFPSRLKEPCMKYFSLLCLSILLAVLASACQADNTALGRVQSALDDYRAGNAGSFEEQFTTTLRRSSAQCPDGLQYSCLQLAYQNFAVEQHSTGPAPQSLVLIPYERQTAPDVQMVLVEGRWAGSPAVISCQVFFVLADGPLWLVDNYDVPQAMTCQQRSAELTENLFGSSDGP
jgi:hypothetical protein